MTSSEDGGKVTFEEAINKAGFGLYSYLLVILSGIVIISVVFVAYNTTIIIPASACELQTTSAQRGLLAGAPIIGLIIGALLWGYLTDVFGRRFTLLISLLSAAIINLLATISVNWVMLMVMQFIATLLASGQYTQAMTLLSESVPMAKRNLVVLLVGTIFLLSQGIMAALAIPIIPLNFSYELPSLGIYWNSWRTLLAVYSLPSLVSLLWLFFMLESPKFLISKGRKSEALEVLTKIHRLNHLGTKEEFTVKDVLLEYPAAITGSISAKERILPLFKPPLLKNTLLLTTLTIFQQIGAFLVWFPTIANQFIQILETGEGSNLTLCGIIRSSINAPANPDVAPCSLNVTSLLLVLGVGAIQSLANAVMSLVINHVGRRNMVMFVTATCGACGIIVNLIPNAIGSLVMFLIFLIGIVCMALYTAITVALFPTSLRALALAFTMTGGRIGSFACVQILNNLLENKCEVGFYVFSSIFASSAVIAFFLANDRRRQKI